MRPGAPVGWVPAPPPPSTGPRGRARPAVSVLRDLDAAWIQADKWPSCPYHPGWQSPQQGLRLQDFLERPPALRHGCGGSSEPHPWPRTLHSAEAQSVWLFFKDTHGPEFTFYFRQVNPGSLEQCSHSDCSFFNEKCYFQAVRNSGLYKPVFHPFLDPVRERERERGVLSFVFLPISKAIGLLFSFFLFF